MDALTAKVSLCKLSPPILGTSAVLAASSSRIVQYQHPPTWLRLNLGNAIMSAAAAARNTADGQLIQVLEPVLALSYNRSMKRVTYLDNNSLALIPFCDDLIRSIAHRTSCAFW